ncbi:FAD-dependent oxidoreductase [Rhodovibrionaceae bacterium A322]
MQQTYSYPEFPYCPHPDQQAETPAHHPVIVIGGGLVGLQAALELAQRGIRALVLDDDKTVSVGSRAICFAKRTLEIYDRYGLAEKLRDKGITWNQGRVFFGDSELYNFNLQPEEGHCWPAFINIQQYYVEEWLVELADANPLCDLRWQNRLSAVDPGADKVTITVETPDGPYQMTCDWLLACDGARSQVRREMGLSFTGEVFQDRFLIADVLMKADFPTERWFWFDPPFHRNQSALLHRQADNVFRIDLQLGWDADPEEEKKPENVIPRLKAMLGDDVAFDLEWVSVYTFQCRRLEKFRHGRVLFAGDAAHQVSPFGARGGNGGAQDVDNLIWKLQLVMSGLAPEGLLDSYDEERLPATDENLLNSTRSTDFITPKNPASRAYRDGVLDLAKDLPFARRLVNSGRLSLPCHLRGSSLNTAFEEGFNCDLAPGSPALDSPLLRRRDPDSWERDWLLRLLGPGFTLVCFVEPDEDLPLAEMKALASDGVPISCLLIAAEDFDSQGLPLLLDDQFLAGRRYDSRPGSCYLFRPDQHLAAAWRSFDAARVRQSRDRALGREAAIEPEQRPTKEEQGA